MPLFRRYLAMLSLCLLAGCGQSEDVKTEDAAAADPVAKTAPETRSAAPIDHARELELVKKITAEQDYENEVARTSSGTTEVKIPFIDPKTGKPLELQNVVFTATKFSDDSIEANGPYREWHADGSKFIEGQYVDGRRDGEWKYFHSNGKVAKVVTYRNGLADGEVVVLREDGSKEAVRNFQAGKWHGLREIFDEKEKPKVAQHYQHGLLHGLRTTWFASGTKQSEQNFHEGKMQGEVKIWHENGQLAQQQQFVDGLRQGTVTVWDEDGKMIRELEYDKGQLVRE